MTEHNLSYSPYGSFTDRRLPLLKVAALWFDKLVILDRVGACSQTIGADYIARDTVQQLKGAVVLEIVTPAKPRSPRPSTEMRATGRSCSRAQPTNGPPSAGQVL
jgi:hypothetical protein